MGRRVSRLTIRKKKRTHSEAEDDDAAERYQDYYTNDEGQPLIPPDEARWRRMNPYGLFAIGDKDGTKHRFRRGQIATILPQGKFPGDPIEPHEYWVGKILEIRADAGSEDSNIIWAKVQWFYSPQDAAGVLKSLATTPLGKFERLYSDHWDFVLPQTFNEVISLPRLYTFPRLPKTRKRSKTRLLLGFKSNGAGGAGAGGAMSRVSDSVSTATTSTMTAGGGAEAEDQEVIGLETQTPISPETFYWRYTLEVQDRKINPKPTSKICLCSTPYNPDSTSLLEGVMLFCPRPTCRTGFHVGCLRDAGSVWKGGGEGDDDQVVVVRGHTTSAKKKAATSRSKAKGKGKAKGKSKAITTLETPLEDNTDEEEEIEYISPRALRLLSTSPDVNHPIDLLGLVARPPLASASVSCAPSSGGGVVPLLQRIHHRQRTQLSAAVCGSSSRGGGGGGGGNEGTSAKSKLSAGSIIEVEDLLIKDENTGDDDNDSWKEKQQAASVSVSAHTRAQTRQSPKKPHTNGFTTSTPSSRSTKPFSESKLDPPPRTRIRKKLLPRPLTPNALLATLFLLPSPFSSSTPNTTSQRSHHHHHHHHHPNTTPTPSTSNHVPPQLNGTTSISTSNNNINNKNINRRLLLELASQPLLRGAAYFPSLGPTGNINPVLAARKLLWQVLRALGDLSFASTPQEEEDGAEEEGNHDDDDEEGYHKIMQCVDGILDGWKERFQADTKIIPSPPPPGEQQVVEDAIVVDELISGLDASASDTVVVEGKKEGEENVNVQVAMPEPKRRPRKRLVKSEEGGGEDGEDEDLLLRVDWVCPGCGGSI